MRCPPLPMPLTWCLIRRPFPQKVDVKETGRHSGMKALSCKSTLETCRYDDQYELSSAESMSSLRINLVCKHNDSWDDHVVGYTVIDLLDIERNEGGPSRISARS